MDKEKITSLVVSAQAGNQDALSELFNTFYADIHYFVLKTVKSEDLALDVTQETFIEIVNTLQNLREPAAFISWSRRVAYHQCTRYFKKKKDVLVEEDEDGNTVFDTLAEENTEFIPDEALDQADFKKTVMDILDELSEEQRSAVLLYYFDELSVKQIADIQGVSEGTVKSRLNYARKAIKASVESYEKKHNIKLHALPFLPMLKWVWGTAAESAVTKAAAPLVAEGVAAATGVSVTTSSVTAVTTTAAAVGLGAKLAALPLVTKIVAGVAAAAVLAGGSAALLSGLKQSEATPTDTPAQTTTTTTAPTVDNLIPEGMVYTLYDGTVLQAGQPFPKAAAVGDTVTFGDFIYKYGLVPTESSWVSVEEALTSKEAADLFLEEILITDTWYPQVADTAKESYGELLRDINGVPITHLYGTFRKCYDLVNLSGIQLPDTVQHLCLTFENCIGLRDASALQLPASTITLAGTFRGCSVLLAAPKIPVAVRRIPSAFFGCYTLHGDIALSTPQDVFENAFCNTKNFINLIGDDQGLLPIAATSRFDNITINGNKISKPTSARPQASFKVPEGCSYISNRTGEKYAAGESVPGNIEYADILICGDYAYGWYFTCEYDAATDSFKRAEGLGGDIGWVPSVIDRTKTAYAPPKTSVLGSSVTTLRGTYRNCVNMVEAPTVPSGITDVSDAYMGCTALVTTPQLPDGITRMFNAFRGCTSLKTVTNFPKNVTEMTQAFDECTSLETIPDAFPSKVQGISNLFAHCHSLKAVPSTLPETVKHMDGAFYYCKSLTAVPNIPSKVTYLFVTFAGCERLQKAPTIPNGVTNMTNTFADCKSLTYGPVIPETVTNADGLFMNCSSLKQAPVIPAAVTNIEDLFYGCTTLSGTVTIHAKNLTADTLQKCFEHTTGTIILKGNSPHLAAIAATAENGNVTLG